MGVRGAEEGTRGLVGPAVAGREALWLPPSDHSTPYFPPLVMQVTCPAAWGPMPEGSHTCQRQLITLSLQRGLSLGQSYTHITQYSSAHLDLSSSVSIPCPGLSRHSSSGLGGRTAPPTESVTHKARFAS